jgi:hypothetical protein
MDTSRTVLTAEHVMQRSVFVVRPETQVLEAVEELLQRGFSGAPVVERGKVVGIFSERDALTAIAAAQYEDVPPGTVAQHMRRDFSVVGAPDELFRCSEKVDPPLPVVDHDICSASCRWRRAERAATALRPTPNPLREVEGDAQARRIELIQRRVVLPVPRAYRGRAMDHATLHDALRPSPERWDGGLDSRRGPGVPRHLARADDLPQLRSGLRASPTSTNRQQDQEGRGTASPGSRGRGARRSATISQSHPLSMARRAAWRLAASNARPGTVLQTLGARIRRVEGARPRSCITSGAPATAQPHRTRATGQSVDGRNSHTNVCSAAAGSVTLWSGYDRPSPDYENAKFTLLLAAT